MLTVDTGAGRTVISTETYSRIPPHRKPKLNKTLSLKGAGGNRISELGEAIFTIELSDLTIRKKVIVAEIEDDGLLGSDILMNDDDGPADILMSRGIIRFKGKDLQCIQVGEKARVRRVFVAKDYSLPGYSEALLDVDIEKFEDEKIKMPKEVLIEPTEKFQEKYSVLMAASIGKIHHKDTNKVRVMNPFPNMVRIKKSMHIGAAECFDGSSQILCHAEHEETQDSNNYLKSMQLIENNQENTICNDGRTTTTELHERVPHHLQEMFAKTTEGKTFDEKQALANLLHQHSKAFSKNDRDLGLTHLAKHKIDTGEALPVKQRPRRVPLAFSGEEKAVIEQLEKQDIIRKSNSPWASPIVLVRKKNGKVRPCVDYRQLNSLTKPDAFPLPRVQDCLDSVAGSVYFSTFDLTSGYHQIPVQEEDIPKTAFVTKYGLYEFTAMPFGLTNAPATFQRVMELALQGLQWSTCLIYLDDIIVFSPSFDSHISRVHEVLQRIEQANLKLKPEKCHLFQSEVEFLGHVVSQQGIKPNPCNVNKILEMPTPTNVTEVRQILGMGNYYRRFIKGYSELVRPLIDLTKKGRQFKWSVQCNVAFQNLKTSLTGPEVMAFPLSDGEFILDCDASCESIGAVLSQKQGGLEKVVAYGSRSLNKAEKNYCITDKELLALRYFVEYFRQYLLGRRFVVRTDHQPLVWLFSLKEPKSRIARWLEILSAYDFAVEHRPGTRHGNADFMSRCPQPSDCECSDEDTFKMMKCGPCKKCRKRAQDMQSSLIEKTLRRVQVKHSVYRFIDVIMTFVWWMSVMPLVRCFGDNSAVSSLDKQTYKSVSITFNFISTSMEKVNSFIKWCKEMLCEMKMVWNSVKVVRKVTTRSEFTKRESVDQSEAWKLWAGICSQSELIKMQHDDEDIGQVMCWLRDGQRPKSSDLLRSSRSLRHYWCLWDSFKVINGILYKKFIRKDGSGSYLQLVVPQVMKKDVLYQMHNAITSGHLGSKKTREKTCQRFYWFEMREDIDSWVARCDICSANKSPKMHPRAPMGTIPVGAPLDRLFTDILGPLPTTPRNNKYILLVTDHFSKWVEIFAVPDQTAETCASKLVNEVISRFGCPLEIHSDQGRNYESDLFKNLCEMLEIKKTRNSPRNPKCNGQAERFNKTLLNMVKSYLKEEQTDWDLNLGILAGAYRAAVHESTGLTPNLVMLGRELRMPAELMTGGVIPATSENADAGSFVDRLRKKINHAHNIARKHLMQATRKQKSFYDVKLSFHQYKPGDCVWYLTGNKPGQSPKLQCKYEGPFVVVEKLNELDYLIQKEYRGRTTVVHHDKLKIYKGDYQPLWAKKFIKTKAGQSG